VSILKIGDRVRVTKRSRLRGYHPGEKGTVIRTLQLNDKGPPIYEATMDKDAPSVKGVFKGVFFDADGVEPDALPLPQSFHPSAPPTASPISGGTVARLKIGDFVRVTSRRLIHGYPAGCRGIVRSGPMTDKAGKTFYTAIMDDDTDDDGTVFFAGEIEPDV
jgi:hypothetical protein